MVAHWCFNVVHWWLKAEFSIYYVKIFHYPNHSSMNPFHLLEYSFIPLHANECPPRHHAPTIFFCDVMPSKRPDDLFRLTLNQSSADCLWCGVHGWSGEVSALERAFLFVLQPCRVNSEGGLSCSAMLQKCREFVGLCVTLQYKIIYWGNNNKTTYK